MGSVMDYGQLFQQSGAQYGIDPDLLKSVAHTESTFNPNAVSPVGAKGLMQMMPATAKSLGIDPSDPAQSVDGAARLLKENLTRYGNVDDAIRAYHGGTDQKNWGDKTENYVNKVSSYFNGLKSNNGVDTQNLASAPAPANSDVDAWLGAKPTQTAQAQPQVQSVDDWLGANAKQATATPQSPVATQAQPVSQQQQTPTNPYFTPTPNKALSDNINQGIEAFGHHAMGSLHGLANLIENGASSVGQYVAPNSSVSNSITNTANKDNQATIDNEKQYQANTPDSVGSYTGAAIGDIAPFMIGGAAKGLQKIGSSVAGLADKAIPTFAAQALGGVAQGAALGAASPVTSSGDYWQNKTNQLKTGAEFGAASPILGSALARIISPKASQAYNDLSNSGVAPTIGQRLGGAMNSIEEKSQSLPIIGDFISKGRNNALNSYNVATLNNIVKPLGSEITQAGHEGVKQAGDIVSANYEKGKAMLGGFKVDDQANGQLQQLQDGIANATNLTDQGKNQINSLIALVKQNISPNGSMLAEGYNELDSKLGLESRRLLSSTDAYQKNTGDAVNQLNSIITDNAKRANPEAAKLLDDSAAAWAKLVRVEGATKAAASNKVNNGIFTPSQLLSAVRGADDSVRGRATARGDALMQDWAQAGIKVLGDKVPNSGTFDRGINGAAIMGAFANPHLIAPAAMATGLTAALYNPSITKGINYLSTARPQAAKSLAQGLRQFIPLAR